MKICLYDWNHGGHHAAFLRLFADALAPDNDVVIAASDAMLEELSDVPVETFSLGAPRPRPIQLDENGNVDRVLDKAVLAREELTHLQSAIDATKPDDVGILYADPVLRWLVRMPPLKASTSLCVHFPRFHYARDFATKLSPEERLKARFQQALTARWRRRPDAKTIYTVDPVATDIWNRRSARWARAECLREPPIPDPPPPQPPEEREGAMVFGYIDPRKGLDRIAPALAEGADGLRMLVAGRNAPEYTAELETHLQTMRSGSVEIERIGEIDHETALTRMGSSRCVILAFGLFPAASRVLLEAATMGTPVVAPDWGLIGYLVRTHRLGVVVDPHDPAAIRNAVVEMTSDPHSHERFAEAQAAYVEHCGWDAFRATIRNGFHV